MIATESELVKQDLAFLDDFVEVFGGLVYEGLQVVQG